MNIRNPMNEFEQVEQELTELRQQLKTSFQVLESLGQFQAEFSDLAQTLKNNSKEINELKQTWINPQDAITAYTSDFESRVKADFQRVFEQIDKTDLNSAQFEKIEQLDSQVDLIHSQLEKVDYLESQIRLAKSLLGTIEQRSVFMNYLSIGAVMISVVALFLSISK